MSLFSKFSCVKLVKAMSSESKLEKSYISCINTSSRGSRDVVTQEKTQKKKHFQNFEIRLLQLTTGGRESMMFDRAHKFSKTRQEDILVGCHVPM